MISRAYKLCRGHHRAPTTRRASWNIYPFHFSDGDNWSADDTRHCIDMLQQRHPPQREPVRLRPGGEPLRHRPVHQGSARAVGGRRDQRGALARSPTRTRSTTRSRTSWGRGAEHAATEPHRHAWRTLQRRDRRATPASFGLDFFETIFEVLDYDELNKVAAYGGFPTRYPHWRFGMEYEQLSKGYEYGLSQDLRDGHQQRPLLRLPARVQRRGRPEAGDGPRLRPLRLLQEQLLLPATPTAR